MTGFNEKTIFVGDTIKRYSDVNESERLGSNHRFSLKTDLFLNPKNVWSIGGSASTRDMEITQLSVYKNYYEPYVILDYYKNDINLAFGGLSIDLNTVYRKIYSSKEHFLEAEIAYSNYDSERNQNRATSAVDLIYYPDGFIPNDLAENTISNSNVKTFRLDYVKPYEHSKLELGTKSILRINRNDYIAGQLNENEVIIPDPTFTNDFIYNENIYATYAQYGGEIKNFSFQAGLRVEYAEINSELVTTQELFSINYFSLYPSVFFLQKLNKKNEINLNYSRRVNRPRSRQLNPFKYSSDPFNIRQGNPELLPEFVNSIEFGYTRYINKSMLNGVIYYRYITDVIENVNFVDDFGVSTVTYQNIGSKKSYGGELTYSGQFYKWWSMNAGFNFYQVNYASGENIELSNAGFNWNIKASNNFKINSSLTAQLSGSYDAPRIIPQGSVSSRWAIDAGIKQDFLKKKASINFRIRDIFNSRNYSYTTTGENYKLVTERLPLSRTIQLSISYTDLKVYFDKLSHELPLC